MNSLWYWIGGPALTSAIFSRFRSVAICVSLVSWSLTPHSDTCDRYPTMALTSRSSCRPPSCFITRYVNIYCYYCCAAVLIIITKYGD